MYSGNSLRSTIAVGNDKKRQRVYNTMFHVPWRCEWQDSLSALDSFLSLLTIIPARIVMTVWRVLNTRGAPNSRPRVRGGSRGWWPGMERVKIPCRAGRRNGRGCR
ncbi:unnamed protein product [Triticum turgidum subsp. durum]|uniref:Uncharacterized protein n=1 Tax=Triticum turgidum subsp. durum TaxID=4567 RepID=A0A9R0VL82_TRITD|nr:unnamed protein product [Triticum turgidum subsp. durum]